LLDPFGAAVEYAIDVEVSRLPHIYGYLRHAFFIYGA
jgi:hypothetical protein